MTLWRPVHIVRKPGTNPTVRNGRVVVDQDTRKVIAWRHYGVVTPISQDDMDAAMGEMEHARSVVAEVADRHRAEAERIAGKLRL